MKMEGFMNKSALLLTVVFLLATCAAAIIFSQPLLAQQQNVNPSSSQKMLKHCVLVKFKSDTNEAQIADLEKSLAALPAVIPEIKNYEFGRDVVRSPRSYDFAVVATFDNLDAMNRYRAHPAHQRVLETIKDMCESILAVDFNY